MNKRIEELAEQAGLIVDKYDMFFAKDNHNEDGVDLEKFARLILRDYCATLKEMHTWTTNMQNHPKIWHNAIDDAIVTLQDRYGVDE